MRLDRLTIFIAVLAGGLLLGIPVALLAIPVADIILILLTEWLAYHRMRQSEKELASLSSPSLPPPKKNSDDKTVYGLSSHHYVTSALYA